MRASIAFVLSSLAVGALAVSQLPALNLYCGDGGLTSADTDVLGSFAVNGNVMAKDWAAGSKLPPAPIGTLRKVLFSRRAARPSSASFEQSCELWSISVSVSRSAVVHVSVYKSVYGTLYIIGVFAGMPVN